MMTKQTPDLDLDAIRAPAEDVLANRREGTVCHPTECFYPTVIQLATGTMALLALVEAVEARCATLTEAVEWFHRDLSAFHNDHGSLNHCEGCRLARAALAAVEATNDK
jgi:hypothetical protein